MKHIAALVCASALTPFLMPAQTSSYNAGLIYLQTIPVPTWTNTGSNQGNFDIFGFNPQTRVMYLADRTNKGITAINTRTNSVVGVLAVPGNPSVNGALIASDLQQLVVTDGRSNVFVYDLRVPTAAPDTYVLPNVKGGTDALDYDPLNQTVYVINGTAPYYITGIDLAYKTVSTQLALSGSPELTKFNPVDGLIYQVINDGDNANKGAGVVAYDPASNSIKATYPITGCAPHGLDIDPVTNTALVGCGTNQAQLLMSLRDGSILKTFPEVTGTDLLAYNPNNRRFYTGSGSNVSTATGCPADSNKNIPVIGVFDPNGQGKLVGVACTGRSGKGPGIDPIQNFIYVATRQYPVDPKDPNTGQPGVMVYYDPAPAAQPLTTLTQASLSAVGGGGALGSVNMALVGRSIRVDAALQSVSSTGMLPRINITTTIGNEGVACGKDSPTTVVCNGPLIGDPVIGGTVLVSVDGLTVAKGTITGK